MTIATTIVFSLLQVGVAAEPSQAAQNQQAKILIERIRQFDSSDGAGLSIRACSLDQDQLSHGAAVALAGLGIPALAPIREALRTEPWRFSSSWLLYAYAKIRGPNAFDELLSSASAQPHSRRSSYLVAAAIASGLTGVVGEMQDVTLSRGHRVILCSALEPRHTLDLFLVSVLRGDRASLARSLGPSGRAQLSALRDEELFPKFGQRQDGQYFSYKMETGGAWFELQPEHSHEALQAEGVELKRDLHVEFLTRQGASCLHRILRFEAFPADRTNSVLHTGEVEYRIETERLQSLLDDIRRCAWAPLRP